MRWIAAYRGSTRSSLDQTSAGVGAEPSSVVQAQEKRACRKSGTGRGRRAQAPSGIPGGRRASAPPGSGDAGGSRRPSKKKARRKRGGPLRGVYARTKERTSRLPLRGARRVRGSPHIAPAHRISGGGAGDRQRRTAPTGRRRGASGRGLDVSSLPTASLRPFLVPEDNKNPPARRAKKQPCGATGCAGGSGRREQNFSPSIGHPRARRAPDAAGGLRRRRARSGRRRGISSRPAPTTRAVSGAADKEKAREAGLKK
jgi:hypothetical protein